MKWERHYTGLETASKGWLYLQRENGKLSFGRLSGRWGMLGIFLGRGNRVKGIGGWEIFTSKYHIGWSKASGYRFRRVEWSGSIKEPWDTFTWRLGSFGIGRTTPKWVVRRMERRTYEQFERQLEEYELALRKELGEAGYNAYIAHCETQEAEGRCYDC